MLQKRGHLLLVVSSIAAVLTLFIFTSTLAASLPQMSPQVGADGQEYVVQRGDWLSRISQKFYGNGSAWQVIVDATNAKAETDSRFTMIMDPDLLEVGQLLWIPDLASSIPSEPSMTDAGNGTLPSSSGATATSMPTTTEIVSTSVHFVTPQNGEKVSQSFDVAMVAEGLGIEPAGEIHDGAGHFHILVDTDFIAPGELLPFDTQHLHFAKGQLTTTLALEPGVHALRLQFGNGAHIALDGEQYRDEITITVESPVKVSTVATSSIAIPITSTATATSSTAISTENVLTSVHFVTPQDGEKVSQSIDVEMAAVGLIIEPDGEIREGAGHFHILVDTDFIAPGELLPFDTHHLHFGEGQQATTLALEPGVHTLRLQLGNGAHIALEGEQYRDEITITVVANH